MLQRTCGSFAAPCFEFRVSAISALRGRVFIVRFAHTTESWCFKFPMILKLTTSDVIVAFRCSASFPLSVEKIPSPFHRSLSVPPSLPPPISLPASLPASLPLSVCIRGHPLGRIIRRRRRQRRHRVFAETVLTRVEGLNNPKGKRSPPTPRQLSPHRRRRRRRRRHCERRPAMENETTIDADL